MPVIATFFGIVVRMYHADHAPPHFHAAYGEHEAIIEIVSGRALAGSLPPRAGALVQEWRKRRRQELLRTWRDARALRPLSRVKPLE